MNYCSKKDSTSKRWGYFLEARDCSTMVILKLHMKKFSEQILSTLNVQLSVNPSALFVFGLPSSSRVSILLWRTVKSNEQISRLCIYHYLPLQYFKGTCKHTLPRTSTYARTRLPEMFFRCILESLYEVVSVGRMDGRSVRNPFFKRRKWAVCFMKIIEAVQHWHCWMYFHNP